MLVRFGLGATHGVGVPTACFLNWACSPSARFPSCSSSQWPVTVGSGCVGTGTTISSVRFTCVGFIVGDAAGVVAGMCATSLATTTISSWSSSSWLISTAVTSIGSVSGVSSWGSWYRLQASCVLLFVTVASGAFCVVLCCVCGVSMVCVSGVCSSGVCASGSRYLVALLVTIRYLHLLPRSFSHRHAACSVLFLHYWFLNV